MTATGTIPVSAPPRVRDLLRRASDGPVRVVHRSPHALYVALGGQCVGLLGRGAVLVPCGLRSRVHNFGSWSCESAYVASGTLHIGGRALTVGRAVAVQVPPLDHEAIPRRAASPVTPAASPQAAVVGLVRHVTPALVGRLVGAGGGLTPLGDDVLCGWIATHRAAGVPTPGVDAAVRSGLHRTTLLSATLLECALQGEVLPQLGRFLRAVGTGDEPGATAALLGVGGSSGAGLLSGARLALDELARTLPQRGAA
jgi:Protein of unknown function (DUF2877)